MSAVLDRLRPHPHRGDVIAAGAVPLALAAIVIELRMTQWALGARFTVVAVIAVLLLTMGWLAPLEGESPRRYHSLLLVSGLLPLIVALQLLAEVLGAARPPGDGALAWTFVVEAMIAAAAARRANSAICTLISALAAVISVQAFVAWAFAPRGPGTFRAVLLVLTLALAAGAVSWRERRPRHAVQLANAGGIVTLALAATLLFPTVAFGALGRFGTGPVSAGADASFGWELWLLAVGFGLVAYSCVDRRPGAGYLGVAVLLAFAVLAGEHTGARGSLIGWPLFLLVLGGVGLAIGLRPRKELPPPPGSPIPAPTIPLHKIEGEGS